MNDGLCFNFKPLNVFLQDETLSPESKFTSQNGKETTIWEYYKNKHNIDIKVRHERHLSDQRLADFLCELLPGVSDSKRSGDNVMSQKLRVKFLLVEFLVT